MNERRWIIFGRKLPPMAETSSLPDWQQARPRWIETALQHARVLPASGWTVVDGSRHLGGAPRRYRLQGRDFVVWRGPGRLQVAPDACPHMGASLAEGRACEGEIVCPWHGLRLGSEPHGSWTPLPTFDDGVLLWVALNPAVARAEGPLLPPRPSRFFDTVIRREARCEPEDIIANRLDPWHGVHLHPYSFGRLRVVEQGEGFIVVRVVYRVGGPFGIEVDARFDCPDPATIVMTILRGEGAGSIVETHATAIDRGRAAVIEATLATSERWQFWMVVRGMSGILRPLVRLAAQRLWADDAAYAERRYTLRMGAVGGADVSSGAGGSPLGATLPADDEKESSFSHGSTPQ